MNDRKNALNIFRNNAMNLFPQGLFSNYLDDDFWDAFGFGDFKVDVREKDDAYIIDAEMPGINKEDIQIDITDRYLTIAVQTDEQNEQKDEEGRYLRRERRSGSFRRSFSLDNIQSDRIKAEMKNGILTINCPKKEQTLSNPRRIQIE